MQKGNEFLTDILISKFSSTLGGLHAIEDPDILENDRKKDELLKRDVYSLVETLSPYLCFLWVFVIPYTIYTEEHRFKPLLGPEHCSQQTKLMRSFPVS